MITYQSIINDGGISSDELSKAFSDNVLKITHPKSGRQTESIQSFKYKQLNILFFRGEVPADNWYLVQATHLFCVGYLDANLAPYSESEQWAHRLEQAARVIRDYQPFSERKAASCHGFEMSNIKPYHFLFDQVLGVLRYPSELRSGRLFADENLYLSTISGASIKPKDKNGFYIVPASNYHAIKSDAVHDSERVLVNELRSHGKPIMGTSNYTLWIGVTGQKRSWVEQVKGYLRVIHHLAERKEQVTVVVDGITGYVDGQLADASNVQQDEAVLNELIDGCKATNVVFNSLIAKPIDYKIGVAMGVDFFISNAGGGCMIPLVFAQLPGIVHSPVGGETFSRFYNKDIKVILSQKYPNKANTPFLRSYHIGPRKVLNAFIRQTGES